MSHTCYSTILLRWCHRQAVLGAANRKASKCVEKQKQTDKKKLWKKKLSSQKKNKCYSLLLNGFQKLLSSVKLWVTPGLETCQLCQAFQSLFAHLERPITRPDSLIGFWECRTLRHRVIIYYIHWYEIKWYNISTYIHICYIIYNILYIKSNIILKMNYILYHIYYIISYYLILYYIIL